MLAGVGPKPCPSAIEIRLDLDSQMKEKALINEYERRMEQQWADREASSIRMYDEAEMVSLWSWTFSVFSSFLYAY